MEQAQGMRLHKLNPRQSQRSSSRKKISMSLCNSHAQFRTPQKGNLPPSPICLTEKKRTKTHAGVPEKYNTKPSLMRVEDGPRQRNKTETQKPVNVHQMRESMKPSTNITSPNSDRKSGFGPAKGRLTLSGNFKSQL
jgi:hypothetical protein